LKLKTKLCILHVGSLRGVMLNLFQHLINGCVMNLKIEDPDPEPSSG
jgi:hypothetical protein